jgi:hypothetical protein
MSVEWPRVTHLHTAFYPLRNGYAGLVFDGAWPFLGTTSRTLWMNRHVALPCG